MLLPRVPTAGTASPRVKVHGLSFAAFSQCLRLVWHSQCSCGVLAGEGILETGKSGEVEAVAGEA